MTSSSDRPQSAEQQLRDDLVVARSFIERGWCQRHLAHDSKGHFTQHDSPSACSWCVRGAMIMACGGQAWSQRDRAMVDALKRVTCTPDEAEISAWNDAPGRTQAQVIAAFDKAIEALS